MMQKIHTNDKQSYMDILYIVNNYTVKFTCYCYVCVFKMFLENVFGACVLILPKRFNITNGNALQCMYSTKSAGFTCSKHDEQILICNIVC